MLPSIFGENLFDDFFSAPFSRALTGTRDPFWGKGTQNLMRTDVKETEAGYELDIDLPGFNKEDMNLELDNGYLTITAKKSSKMCIRDRLCRNSTNTAPRRYHASQRRATRFHKHK